MEPLHWLPRPAVSDLRNVEDDAELIWEDLDDGISVVYKRYTFVVPIMRNMETHYIKKYEDNLVFIGAYAIGV